MTGWLQSCQKSLWQDRLNVSRKPLCARYTQTHTQRAHELSSCMYIALFSWADLSCTLCSGEIPSNLPPLQKPVKHRLCANTKDGAKHLLRWWSWPAARDNIWFPSWPLIKTSWHKYRTKRPTLETGAVLPQCCWHLRKHLIILGILRLEKKKWKRGE